VAARLASAEGHGRAGTLSGLYKKLVGRPTIHPALFYTGKLAGYGTWVVMLLSLAGAIHIRCYQAAPLDYTAYAVLALGLAVSAVSMFNLGGSTTLGLPAEKRAFKQSGLYRLSRNPMYVGFDLITLASIVYHANPYVGIAGAYSAVVYHLIVLGEEKYLLAQYGEAYRAYQGTVRRYL
jgi:protein-S-isoprenylcysteine O-methyltransferase Ste14